MKQEVSAGGIVYKIVGGKLEWLITQHSGGKHWSFPKGLVGDYNPGEPLEEAALREVEEEGGVKAKIVKKIDAPSQYFYTFKGQKIFKTVWFFLMEYVSGSPEDHDWEVSEARFAPAEEVLLTLTFENDKKIFKRALEMAESLS